MNEHDSIEKALAELKPAELPPQLMARLTAARPQAAKAEPRGLGALLLRWLLPLGVGACAAVAVLTFLQHDAVKPAVAKRNAPMPFESEERLVSARDMGVVNAPGNRPFRLVEVEWLVSDTVRPRESGPAVRVETTRREVIPVALEIY